MSKGIIDRIHHSRNDDQEAEDEDVIIAKKINVLDQQVKALQGRMSEVAEEFNSAKKLLNDHVIEQRAKMQLFEKVVSQTASKLAIAQESMDSVDCYNCGDLNPLLANFCDRCGVRLL